MLVREVEEVGKRTKLMWKAEDRVRVDIGL